ncbi:DinB family protein [Paenibacillus soyae]|uniref:DinB family protein n=1 Tax=Paenibacillus soyae TaxID=2969249 RepID=A0A9X2MS58_9BACL|nr:DinB family protein [Paenibacillus soyae]MCR2805871.1 DinB family protein [Paenibacillus soyae]
MSKTITQLIEEFEALISYARRLNEELDEQRWNEPIAEGKWTVKHILSHILLWDRYFYEEGIAKIKKGEPLTLKHLDFDEFNAGAPVYASSRSKREVTEDLIQIRAAIIDAISGLSEEEYSKVHTDGDGHPFTIRRYLEDFVPHDAHHRKQIDTFLS